MAFKLVLLSMPTLTLAHLLGIIPNPRHADISRKSIISETLAITSSLLAQHREDALIEENLRTIVQRYPDVQSACIRRRDRTIVHQIGDHQRHWYLAADAASTRDNIYVPITSGEQAWGTVELSFAKEAGFVATLLHHPVILLGAFTICLNGLIFWWYLLRAFNYLDPTKSVPMHVRSTLDTFSEGVVVLDNEQRIVLANDKFKQHIGKSDHELLGQQIDRIPWECDSEDARAPNWQGEDPSPVGVRLRLQLDQKCRTFLVNASAIHGGDGRRRGTVASFDDITPLEQKREELSKMLQELLLSRDELRRRNTELQYLATRDSLTGCLNRRTFLEIFDKQWHAAHRHQQPLSCIMVDVDHFKDVNDNHGHAVGDEVLVRIARTIQEAARESDVLCRYGGEEFCVLLSQTDTAQACLAAEHLRCAVEQLAFERLSVTVSLGVSSVSLGAANPHELLDQADKCLYVAKRRGRNQLVRWDEISDHDLAEGAGERRLAAVSPSAEQDTSIPYPAVASLISALAYRDAATAAHSIRVAELCVATASGLLTLQDTYVLEVAALLHDIGKIGVPDAILLKPGPLTAEEWATMELHDRIGVEIVEASFANQQLVDIVRFHHAKYGGSSDAPRYPKGKDIPLGARIVTIADAYDAIVSDRVYRMGRPPEEAFKELRRCAESQFDPDLVERFIEIARDHQSIELPVESKHTALQVGLQIERLAQAVDDNDSAGIKALAARLETTAARGGIREIEEIAGEIKRSTEEDGDLVSLLQMVEQLLSLCRSAQRVYTDTNLRGKAARKLEPARCPAGQS